MSTASDLRPELVRELARVRLILVGRQVARAAMYGVALGAAGVLLGVLFGQIMPWMLVGSAREEALVAIAALGVAGALAGVWRSFSAWSWPSDLDCALAIEDEHADASLPTAVGLAEKDGFALLVMGRASQALSKRPGLRLSAAIPTPLLVAVPLLALCSTVLLSAGLSLPVVASARKAPVQAAMVRPLRSSVSAHDMAAYAQALGEREQQSALAKAASDIRDATKSDADMQASLDAARAAAAKAGANALKDVIPERVPPTMAEREALAKALEAAAASAGARADALERGKGAGVADAGSTATPEAGKPQIMQPAPVYDPRRFEDAREALSDQSGERRALAQAAADALAKIKQGR